MSGGAGHMEQALGEWPYIGLCRHSAPTITWTALATEPSVGLSIKSGLIHGPATRSLSNSRCCRRGGVRLCMFVEYVYNPIENDLESVEVNLLRIGLNDLVGKICLTVVRCRVELV